MASSHRVYGGLGLGFKELAFEFFCIGSRVSGLGVLARGLKVESLNPRA